MRGNLRTCGSMALVFLVTAGMVVAEDRYQRTVLFEHFSIDG